MWGSRHFYNFQYLSNIKTIRNSIIRPTYKLIQHKQQLINGNTNILLLRSISSAKKIPRRKPTSVSPRVFPNNFNTEIVYGDLLRTAITRQDANLAWTIYKSQKPRGLDYVDYRNLAWLLKRNLPSSSPQSDGDLKKIEVVLTDMLRSGMSHDIDIFNALLTACYKAKDLSRLQRVWEDIQQNSELTPNTATCCTVINAFAEQTSDYKNIRALFDLFVNKGYSLDAHIFESFINAYANFEQLDEAEKVLSYSEIIEIPKEPHAYNALMYQYVKQRRNMDSTLAIYHRMISKDIRPNAATFNTLIKGHMENNNIKLAMDLFENEMVKKWNIDTNIVTVNIMIAGNFKAANFAHKSGDKGEAEEYMEKAREWYLFLIKKNIDPTVVTFNSLIRGFGDLNRMTEVKKCVAEMQQFKVTPTLITFQNLASVYGVNGDADGVKLVWDDMIKMGLEPNERTLQAFTKAAMACSATELAVQMMKTAQDNWSGKWK